MCGLCTDVLRYDELVAFIVGLTGERDALRSELARLRARKTARPQVSQPVAEGAGDAGNDATSVKQTKKSGGFSYIEMLVKFIAFGGLGVVTAARL